mmetsp:Transcript_9760/g.27936  ORF Transcript_9760/g.27936 Transcript_9760/m.27936 type:complete len:699 (+) Transcript_9760:433-2529(+)
MAKRTACEIVALLLVSLLGLLSGQPAGKAAGKCENDGEPPAVRGITISPNTVVDVTSRPVRVTVGVALEDAGSPIDLCSASFRSSNRKNTQFVVLSEVNRECTDGGRLCTLQLAGTVPQHVVAETWKLELSCRDKRCDASGSAGNPNTFTLSGEQLTVLGFDSAIQVRSGEVDTQAPVLKSLKLSPRKLTVEGSSQEVTAIMVVEDEISGVESCLVTLRSPKAEVRATMEGGESCKTGRTTCTFTLKATLHSNSPPGDWRPSLFCKDAVQNRLLLTAEQLEGSGVIPVTVSTLAPDTDPPTLLHFSLNTSFVNLHSGPAAVETTTVMLDASSRLADCTVMLHSPNGQQVVVGSTTGGACSNDHLRCTYLKQVVLPASAAVGMWRPTLVCGDVLQNRGVWSPRRLEEMGFSVALNVLNTVDDREPPILTALSLSPSPTADPSLDAIPVDLTLMVSDVRSGAGGGCVAVLHSPAAAGPSVSLTSSAPPKCGTSTGMCDYQLSGVLLAGSSSGDWPLSVACKDLAGNGFALWGSDLAQLGFKSFLTVVPASQSTAAADSGKPIITSFTVSPSTVQPGASSLASSDGTAVIVSLSVKDTASAIDTCVVVFIHSSMDTLFVDMERQCQEWQRECVFLGTADAPTSLPGTWSAAVSCSDAAGNTFALRSTWLESNGFDSGFEMLSTTVRGAPKPPTRRLLAPFA